MELQEQNYSFKEYSIATNDTDLKTLIGDSLLPYYAMGLAGEAAEVGNKVKKLFRDKEGKLYVQDATQIANELGDVLWYIARMSEALGYDLEWVAQQNINKLKSRKERGAIKGNGDSR